jgi:hypothetical protein
MTTKKVFPYIYFICGLASACDYDSALSFYPGILLMLVACLIWIRQLESPDNHSGSSGNHASGI